MPLYPARALESAMKISEVITRAISGKINWEPGGRDFRDVRPAIEAKAEQLGQVWLRWTVRPPNPATESEASADGTGEKGITAVSREVLRSQCEAFCREAAQPRGYPTQLHLGKNSAAKCRASEARSASSKTARRRRHPCRGGVPHFDVHPEKEDCPYPAQSQSRQQLACRPALAFKLYSPITVSTHGQERKRPRSPSRLPDRNQELRCNQSCAHSSNLLNLPHMELHCYP
jgi:hypothetical protein